MFRCSVPRVRAFAAAVLLAGGAAAQPVVGIAEVAPPESFLVFGVSDWTRSAAALEGSEMGRLWAEPKVQEFVKRVSEEPMAQWAAWLEDINAEPEDFAAPAGAVGLAVFMPANWEAEAEAAGDDEPPTPHVLAMADFGAGVDTWADLLERLLDQGEDDGAITRRADNYAGVEIIIVEPVPNDDNGENEFAEPRDPLGALIADRGLFLARVGGTWTISTDQAALEGAIETLQGKDRPSLADAPAYTRSLGQHPRELDAFGAVVAAPLGPVMKRIMNMEFMLGMEDATPLFEALGLTDFDAFSVGVRLDAGQGMPEQTMGVLMPQKRGLVALLAQAGGGALEPPAFIGPEAATVSRIRFQFDGLIGTLRGVLNALPEDARAQAGAMFEEFAQLMGPAFAQLGPDVYIVQTYVQPLEASSDVATVAIQVRDPLVISNTVTFLTAQAPGMFAPRDFQGNTIHESQEAGLAIGQGFGYVFVGPAAGVENAMRAAGSPDAPKLSGEPAFQEAVRALGAEGVVATYSDLEREIEWVYWQFQNLEKVQEEQMRGFQGWEPEEREEYLRSFRAAQPAWIKELPPLDVIRPYLGVSVGQLRATPDGFQGRSLMLPRR